jgi:hypothetical protein
MAFSTRTTRTTTKQKLKKQSARLLFVRETTGRQPFNWHFQVYCFPAFATADPTKPELDLIKN